MAEDKLQTAFEWKKKFAEATAEIDKDHFERALPILGDALQLAESLDKEDLRVAETMERMAYAKHKLGQLDDAEPLYRRALELARIKMLSFSLKQLCTTNLAALLRETGRTDEAEVLQSRYPKPVAAEDRAPAPVRSPEQRLLTSLSSLSYSSRTSVVPLMEDLLALIETVCGAESLEAASALEDIGRALQQHGIDSLLAGEYHRKSFLIKQQILKEPNADLAASMRYLSACEPDPNVSRALVAKARSMEKALEQPNPVDKTVQLLMDASGQTLPAEMPPSQAEKILDEWRRMQPKTDYPYVSIQLTKEQRYRQLLSLLGKALFLATSVEAGKPHPLNTVSLLSELSLCHKELGEIQQAKTFKEKEMRLIAKHWGDGHLLMVEAAEEYEQLDSVT